MAIKEFKASTLEQCLQDASAELNIEIDNLKYTIIEEKKGLFKKSATISVEFEEIVVSNGEDGTIKVENGVFIIKDPQAGGRPAVLKPRKEIKIFVDGMQIADATEVLSKNKISVEFEENTASRNFNLTISPDNMEAYVTIEYIPQNKYALEDKEESHEFLADCRVCEQVFPPKYTIDEIKENLSNKGIIYGIIEENMTKCVEQKEINNILIAKGKETIDGVDDIVELKCDIQDADQKGNPLKEDKEGRVDFKSIGFVQAVKKGQEVAVLIPGIIGEAGKDIFGIVKSAKTGKKATLKVGSGCVLEDGNRVIAAMDGKPTMKSGAFCVNEIHEISGDVDLKSGNIKFVGDIIINGAVQEGMEVEGGSSVLIHKDVERAKIIGKGDVTIKGNLISSSVKAGGEDVQNIKQIQDLQNFKNTLGSLLRTVEEVKKFNLLGYATSDGQMIKVLIENKFKLIPKLCLTIAGAITMHKKEESHEVDEKLIQFIKGKLIGLAPLNIKNFHELEDLITLCDQKSEILKGTLSVPVNLVFPYCQDSEISSTGDVVITGKGEYISNITANNGIYFMSSESIARGGVLKAKTELKCKTVGSSAGVATKLIVQEKGHIWADVAYQNTIFVVGDIEYQLETPSKSIHAYLDSKGEFTIDKFKL